MYAERHYWFDVLHHLEALSCIAGVQIGGAGKASQSVRRQRRFLSFELIKQS